MIWGDLMASEKILRKSAFGGFKKTDVIDYIEKIETARLEQSKRAAELEGRLAEAQDAAALCDELSAELARSREEKAELEKQLEALEEKNAQNLERIRVYDENLASLEEKLAKLEESCADISDSEQQINCLVMDAVMYSDKIIGKARDAAKAVSEDAKQSIVDTTGEIDSISAQITRISGEFGSVITALSEKLGALSKNIGELTSRFDAPQDDEEEGQFRLNEDGLVLLDEIYLKMKNRLSENKELNKEEK